MESKPLIKTHLFFFVNTHRTQSYRLNETLIVYIHKFLIGARIELATFGVADRH